MGSVCIKTCKRDLVLVSFYIVLSVLPFEKFCLSMSVSPSVFPSFLLSVSSYSVMHLYWLIFVLIWEPMCFILFCCYSVCYFV